MDDRAHREREAASHPAPAVVLVRPQEEGNIGAAARAMANFGLDRLILVAPEARLGGVARAFAVGAGEILARAEIVPTLPAALAEFRRVVATTSARDRALDIPQLSARELPALLAADRPGTATALVFGPERSGLTNDELALASAVVRIPCAPAQPTLNLAQAVLLVAYERFAALAAPPPAARREPPASFAEIAGLFSHFEELFGRSGFARDDTAARVERDLRQLLSRAAPSAREVRLLRGLLRRTGGALARAGLAPRRRGPDRLLD